MSPVYIVDDDEAVRDSLSLLFEAAGYTVEAFASAMATLDRCRRRQPDCIVTDVRMPGMDGIEFQARLAELGIVVPIVIITGHGDVSLAVQAMKAGASDFIEKPFTDDTILTSLAEAIGKGRDSGRAAELNAELRGRLDSLTAREREVLDRLVTGDPNKVIAYRLEISPRTVEIHRARVMQKMQARSLPELVRMAMSLGILPLS